MYVHIFRTFKRVYLSHLFDEFQDLCELSSERVRQVMRQGLVPGIFRLLFVLGRLASLRYSF